MKAIAATIDTNHVTAAHRPQLLCTKTSTKQACTSHRDTILTEHHHSHPPILCLKQIGRSRRHLSLRKTRDRPTQMVCLLRPMLTIWLLTKASHRHHRRLWSHLCSRSIMGSSSIDSNSSIIKASRLIGLLVKLMCHEAKFQTKYQVHSRDRHKDRGALKEIPIRDMTEKERAR